MFDSEKQSSKQQMTEKPKKITLPDIEGVQIPRYVRQLASGQHNRLTRNVSFGEMDEKINVLHNELVSFMFQSLSL